MSDYQQPPEGKDPELWEIAQKRASFKSHLVTYILVNGFFMALWYFTGDHYDNDEFFPWPVWSMLGWGVVLAFDFADAYIFTEAHSVEKEYQKLKKNNKN